MISNCLRTAIISALILMGQSAAAAQSVPARITIQDMLSDLDTLYSIIEESHPDLYRATDKAAIESRWVGARKDLKKPLTTIEFLNFVAPLINQYRDGHTGMDLAFETEEFQTYVKNGGRFFPFGVMIVGDKIYITQSLGETKLAPGTEITAIGGRSSAKVLGELRPFAMGDTPAGRDSTLSRLFAHYLWQVYGGVGSFELRVRPPRRAATSAAKVAAEGVDLDTLSKAMFGDEAVRAYELTPEIFVIEINKMQSNDKVKKAVDDAFAAVREKNYSHLVIDLRKNGGGNSVVGQWALDHLTRRAYNQGGTKEVRISPYLLENNKFFGGWIPELKARFPVEGDRIVVKFEGDSDVLNNEKWVYPGKTLMLTSPRTYSSGFMMAEAFKCYKVGRIVGESPGSFRNLSGEMMQFRLPKSKLVGYVASARFLPPCYQKEKTDFLEPDVEIRQTVEDLAAGRDTALEYLKKLTSTK